MGKTQTSLYRNFIEWILFIALGGGLVISVTKLINAREKISSLTREVVDNEVALREEQDANHALRKTQVHMDEERQQLRIKYEEKEQELRAKIEMLEAQNLDLSAKIQKWEAFAAKQKEERARQLEERARQVAEQNAANEAALKQMRAQQAKRQRELDGKREAERFQGYWNEYYFFSDGVTSKGWYARTDISVLGAEAEKLIRAKIQRDEKAREETWKKLGEAGMKKFEHNDAVLRAMYEETQRNPKKIRK